MPRPAAGVQDGEPRRDPVDGGLSLEWGRRRRAGRPPADRGQALADAGKRAETGDSLAREEGRNGLPEAAQHVCAAPVGLPAEGIGSLIREQRGRFF
jgi:hypothetical protein